MVRFANVNRTTTNNISSVLCNDYMCNMKRKSTLVDSVSAEPKVSAVGRKRLSLTVIPQNKANRLRNVSSEPVYAEPPARRSQSPTRQRATFNFSLLTAFAVLLCLMFGGTAWGQTTLWSENFEGGSMHSGWTTDGSGSWSVATAVNSTHPSSAGEGTYCAQIKHGSTGNATKLITPAIDLSSVTSAELSFMHAEQSWSGDIDGLKVYYRTSTSGTWTQLVEYIDAYASWTTESEIILPNLSSTYQLAFEYIDNYGYGLGIDDIKIVQGASCVKPINIAVNTPTTHGATVSWTGTSDSYIVMVGEANVSANYNFETGTMPAAFTNNSTNAWSVELNNHSGAYCAKSAGGFTSTNSDLSLTVTLSSAGFVSFSAMASSESGWDYGRFLIDGTQKIETSGTSNNWTDYSYPLEAGQHTLIWRYYKDGSGDQGDDCFYVDDIVVISEPASWHQYPATSSPYTINDATNINSATPYMVYVIGVCGGEQSDPSTTANFTTEVSCPKPTGLTVGTITTTTATISWTPGGSETAWQYTLDDGANWNDFASAPTGTTTKTGTIT